MKPLLIIFTASLAASLAFAQPPTTIIPGTPVTSATMNANFLGLYNGRVGRWSGAGAPGSFPFSIIGDDYTNTATSPPTFYKCARATACNAVGSGNWQLLDATSGTVTTISGSGPSWLTWTIANPTSAPAISLTATTGQTSHQVIGTCNAATIFGPCALVPGDLPSATVFNNQANTYSGGLQNFGSALLLAPNGTSNPATCTVGQVFFRSDLTAGQNWEFCTATNTWTQQLNSGGGGNTYTSVTTSTTPIFTRSSANQEWSFTVSTSNSTATTSGLTSGDILTFNITQCATSGGCNFTWPTGFSEACTIANGNAFTGIANLGIKQTFYWDGSAAHAMTGCVTTAAPPGAGILRGDTPSATELSGDCTTSGSNAVTCTKINGTAFPTSASVVGSNGSAQPVAASAHGLSAPKLCLDSSGSGTAQSCTTSPTFVPAAGDTIIYKTTTTNTGDVTINVNSSSAVHIRKWQGSAVLASGDLVAGVYVTLTYDGTYWETYTIGNAPTGGSTTNTTPWLCLGGCGGAYTGTLTTVANTIYCWLANIPGPTQIAKILYNTGGSTNQKWAIYSANGSSSALLASSGVGTGCGGCNYAVAFSYTFTAPGAYYVCFSSDGNAALSVSTGTSWPVNVGTISSPVQATTTNTGTWSGGAYTFPSTTGTLTPTATNYVYAALTY
jgi:hypothetical protein